MSALPPIPTPPALRWREFRIRTVPVLVVAATLVTCAYIWSHHVVPTGFVGEVEPRRATITSKLPGTLARLTVSQFSPVKAGEEIAQVVIADPRVLESTLAMIRSEVNWLRVSADPLLRREEGRLDYERLRLNVLDERTLVAMDRVRLQFAEAELARVATLRSGGAITNIASQAEYEAALRDRDALLRGIEERQIHLRSVEESLQQLRIVRSTNQTDADPDVFRAAVELQEKKLRLAEAEMNPITLVAPIEGTVSTLYRRAGENIVAGEPILTITAPQSQRIIGFLIPPLPLDVQTGMTVRVRTRSLKREVALAQIMDIGNALDVVPPLLGSVVNSRANGLNNRGLDVNNRLMDVGLPVAVSLPPELKLRPGELVDLALEYHPR